MLKPTNPDSLTMWSCWEDGGGRNTNWNLSPSKYPVVLNAENDVTWSHVYTIHFQPRGQRVGSTREDMKNGSLVTSLQHPQEKALNGRVVHRCKFRSSLPQAKMELSQELVCQSFLLPNSPVSSCALWLSLASDQKSIWTNLLKSPQKRFSRFSFFFF